MKMVPQKLPPGIEAAILKSKFLNGLPTVPEEPQARALPLTTKRLLKFSPDTGKLKVRPGIPLPLTAEELAEQQARKELADFLGDMPDVGGAQ